MLLGNELPASKPEPASRDADLVAHKARCAPAWGFFLLLCLGNLSLFPAPVTADSDTPALTIADVSASEGDGLSFTVTLDEAVQGGLTVTPGYTDGTATAGTDYTKNTAALTFAGTAGEQKAFTVATTEDNVVERNETFTVGLTVSGTMSGSIVDATDTATGTITNDDTATISGVSLRALESSGFYSVSLRLSNPVWRAVPINFTTSVESGQTATSGTDFVAQSGSIGFSAGKTSVVTGLLTITNDTIVEGDETFTFKLSEPRFFPLPDGVELGNNAVITILDDDQAALSITNASTNASAFEADGLVFTVTLDKVVQGGLTATPTYTDVTTTSADYTKNTAALTFAGTAGEQKTFTVTTEDDAVELNETFTVGLSISGAPARSPTPLIGNRPPSVASGTATGTIQDDDFSSLEVASASAAEGEGLVFTVKLDKPVQGGLTVTPTYTDGTATTGTDYTRNTAALTFAGTAKEQKTFTVATIGNDVVEANKTFTVGLTIGGAVQAIRIRVDTTTIATGTITNDDTATISIMPQSFPENSGMANFTIRLSNPVASVVSVPYTISAESGQSAGPGVDFDAISSTITVASRDKSPQGRVTILDDSTLEPNETFTVTLSEPSGGFPDGVELSDSARSAVFTIIDDEAPALTIEDVSADEGDDLVFTVTLDKPVQGGLIMTPSYTDVTTTAGTDYTKNTVGAIFAGTAGEQKSFTVATTDDGVVEEYETFTVGLKARSTVPATVVEAGIIVNVFDTATATINDNDSAVIAYSVGGISLAPIRVTETDSSYLINTSVNMYVNEQVPGSSDFLYADRPVTINFRQASIAGQTAMRGMDFNLLDKDGRNPGALQARTIPVGEDSTGTPIAIIGDDVVEPEERFVVQILEPESGFPRGIGLGTSTTVEYTITDDDSAVLSITDASASEGDDLVFTVTLDKAVQGGLTVTPTYTDVTTTSADYTQNTATLTFAGTAGEQKTFTVATTENEVLEVDETFTVGLTAGGASEGVLSRVSATDTAIGTIIDDDVPTLTITNSIRSEGDSMYFVVTLDKPVPGGLSVTPTYTDVTTTSADYTQNTAVLTFAGNAGEKGPFTVLTTEDDVVEEDETFTVGLTVSGLLSDGLLRVDATDTATGTIQADDDSAVLSIADVSASEGDDLVFTVTLNKPVQGGLTVTPGYTDGSAASTDYTKNTAALTFAGTAGEQKAFTVATAEDNVVEADETFTVRLTAGGASRGILSRVNATDTAIGTITNDDTLADSSVTANPTTIAEAGGTSTLTVSTGGVSFPGDQTITLTPGGTATENTDYTLGSKTLTLAAGQTSVATTVTAANDSLVEGDETVVLSATLGDTELGSATVTITDDDSAVLSIADVSASEGDGLVFTVTLDKAVQDGLTVTPGYTDGTATAGTDYTQNTAALTFAGTAGEQKAFTVATTEDNVVEADETFTVGLTAGGALQGVLSRVNAADTAIGTITDDDSAVLSIADVSASEGDDLVFTVTLDKAVQDGLTVTPGYTDGTATAGTDYTQNTAALTFAGTAGEQKAFTVATTEDNVVEADETFTVGLTAGGALQGVLSRVNAADTAIGTITDDDSAVLSIADVSASEGDDLVFTVTLDKAVQDGLTVTPGYTDGTATAGTDYTQNTAALTFAGTAGEQKAFTVATTEDNVVEADETFTVGLTAGGALQGVLSRVNAADTAIGTITNDDTLADSSVTANPTTVVEAGGTSTLTVSTGGVSFPGDQTITLTPGGTATENTDYTLGSKTLTLAAGQTSVATTVTAANDSLVEGDETVVLSATLGDTELGSATVTITDDDSAVLSIADVSASEGDGLVFTVTLDKAVQDGLTVTPGYTDGTATAGTDYTQNTAALTFAGTAGEQKAFTVATTEDNVVEADETFTVGLTAGGALQGVLSRVNAADTAIGTITDDDSAVLSIADVSASEGDDLVFTVTLDKAVQDGLTVTPGYTDGTATAGTDYTQNTAALTFAGTAGEQKAFTVATTEDNVVEADETFTVGLTAGGASEGLLSRVNAADTAIGTITNDDTLSGSVTANPTTIAEAGGTSTLTVSTGGVSYATDQTITLTPSGTATENTDYTLGSKTLTLAAGQTSVATTVTAVNDSLVEGAETVTLAATLNGTGLGNATVTITDDDSLSGSVTANPTTIAEAGGTSTLTVSTGGVSYATDQTITLTPSGTATENTDYTLGSKTLTLAAGQTSVATTVTAVNDSLVEGAETVTLAATLNGTGLGNATVTITDDDTLSGSVTANPTTIAEAGGTSTLTVSTGGVSYATDQTITLTPSGTATENTDYTLGSKTLTLAAGQTSVATTVTAVNDSLVEGAETVTLAATLNGTGLGNATVTITDDDSLSGSVTANPTTIAEAGGTSTLTVSTGGVSYATDQTITLTPSGTATENTDYTLGSKTLTLAAGQTSVATTVAAVNDSLVEGAETVTLAATLNGTGLGNATVTITDDDTLSGSVTANPTTIAEAGGTSTLTVSTGGVSYATDQTITLTPSGTATENTDYTLGSKTLTLAAGQTSVATTVTAVNDSLVEGAETVTLAATLNGTGLGNATVTITDDDSLSGSVTANPTTIAEAGGTSTLTVSTGGVSYATDQTITLTPSGTATENTDYTLGSKTLTLAAGQTSVATTVTAVNDSLVEGAETVTLAATLNGTGLGNATVTITDDDTLSGSVTANPTTIAEAGGTSTLTVSTGGVSYATDQTITLTPSGTATENTDYTLGSKTLTLAAGQTSVATTVTAVNDSLVEGAETVTLAATLNGTGLGNATVTITDDDTLSGSVTANPTTIAEAGGTSTLTVSTGGVSYATDQTITLTPSGTATENTDYTLGSKTLTLAAGQTSVATTVTAVNDSLVEGAETVTLAATLNGTGLGNATVTITDDDSLSGSVTANPTTIAEAGGTSTLTVSTGGVSYATDQTITLTPSGTATENTDYTLGSKTLTLAAGQTSVATTVAAVNDSLVEGAETVTLAATLNGTGLGNATVTITDDDTLSGSVTANPTTIAEAGGTSTLTVSTGGVSYATDQTITLTPSGTATENTDYTLGSKTLTLAAGQTSVATTVTAVNDSLVEGAETVTLAATLNGTGLGNATVTITDDDSLSGSVTANPTTIAEAGGTSTLTVSTGGVSYATDQTITLTPSGTATENTDYTLGSKTLTLAAGQTSVATTVTAVNDSLVEGAETVTLAATLNGTGLGNATVTITDDDSLSGSVTANPTTIAEAGGTSTLTVSTGGVSYATDQTITLTPSGTATENTDYTLGSKTLTLAAGQTSVATTVTAVNDSLVEGAETVTLAATLNGTGLGNATVTITDDDSLSGSVTANPTTIAEAGGTSTLTVSTGGVSYATDQTITLTPSGTATENTDYTLGSKTLTLAAGQTSVATTVAAVNDSLVEGAETVTLAATLNGTGLGNATVTITDDDTLSGSVTANPTTIAEAGGTSTLTVSTGGVSYATDQTITLTPSGTATENTDYTLGSKTLTLAAGQTSVATTVTAVNDSLVEGAETVTLAATLNGTGLGNATVTITDDDSLSGSVTANPTTIAEAGGTSTLTVSTGGVSYATDQTITLTPSGTATENTDYTLGSKTLTLAAGQTSVATTVTAVNDSLVEGAETVTLAATLNGTGLGNATVTITDDDTLSGSVTANPTTIAEAGGTSTLTVSTGGVSYATDQTITLTPSGTATENTDYTLGSKTLTLAAGQTSVATTVTAVNDSLVEGAETVTLAATLNGTGLGNATVTITDDDTLSGSVTANPTTIAEAGGTSTLTVSTGGVSYATDQTITLTPSGTATENTDYTLGSKTLTLAAGQTSVATTVTAVNDSLVEGAETVTLAATLNGTGLGNATVTITDDDSLSGSVTANPTTIAEAGGTSTLTVSTGGVSYATDQTITLTPSGTATENTDYTLGSKTLTLAAGQTSVATTVAAVNDSLVEGAETVTLAATLNGTGLGNATVTITDDDTLSGSVTANPTTIAEAGGTSTLTVSTGGVSYATDQTITLTPSGTATENTDYTLGSKTLTLAAGQTSVATTVTAVNDSLVEGAETVTLAATLNGTGLGNATVTITDDDSLSGSVTANPTTIAEAGGTSTLTVSTGGVSYATDQTITLTPSGTATENTDYTLGSKTLTLAAGQTSVATTVTAVNDSLVEGAETVTLAATLNGTGLGNATVTITDDDSLSGSVTANPTTIAEAGGTSTLTVSTGGVSYATDQTITLTPSGTATENTDYTLGSKTLTLAAGQTSVATTVTAVNDSLVEGAETVTLAATLNGTGLGNATVTITDDDSLSGSVTANPTTIAEAGGTSTLTVSTGGVSYATDQTITLTPSGTATENTDYTLGSKTLTLAAGQTSVATTVTAVNDSLVEGAETVTLAATLNGTGLGNATVTITDDDSLSGSVTANPTTIAEAGGTSTLTVSTGGVSYATDQTITLTPSGTATENTDYTLGSKTLTLAAGQTSVATTVTAVNDSLVEGAETVTLAATLNGTGLGNATVTITDDDSLSGSVTANPTTIAEAGGTSTLTVSTGGVSYATDQTITLTPSGTATENTDYTLGSKTLTLAAGQTSVATTVTAVNDSLVEGAETVTLAATLNGTGLGNATVTITDDDSLSGSVTANPTTIAEAGGTSTLTVSTGGVSYATDQTITLTPSGTATENTDYTLGSKTLTLAAGQTSVATTVTAVNDSLVEGAETVTLAATLNGTGLGNATVTITDDDTLSGSVTANPTTIAEAGGTSTLTVSTGGVSYATDQTITLTPSGTATENTDYTLGSKTLTLAAGQTSVATTVTAVNDSLVEGAETVTLAATLNGTGLGNATVTITDDDSLSGSVTANPTTIAEAGGTSTLTVSTGGVSYATDQTITLTPSGTATENTDYTLGSKTLTLAAGQTSVATTVTAVNDSLVEGAETVTLAATLNGTGLGNATVTITDDDSLSGSVTANPTTIAEAGGTSTLTVSTGGVSYATDQTITLTPSGTATENTDYTLGSKTLTLAAGQTSVATTVTAVNDSLVEGAETVTLAATLGGSTGLGSATVTITDDDAPSLSVWDANAPEGDDLIFTVTLDEAVQGGLTVTPSYTDGTAMAGTDYTQNTAVLTFAGTAGEQKTFTVATTEDDVLEADETFTVALSVNLPSTFVNLQHVSAPSTVAAIATGTITNDDALEVKITPSLSISDASAPEGDDLIFTVMLDETVQGSLAVTPDYTDGTALSTGANADYTRSTAALTFAGIAGEKKTFTVATTEDDAVEADETFTVGLSVSQPTTPEGLPRVNATATATGTIINDDVLLNRMPTVSLTCNPSCETVPGGSVLLVATASDPDGDVLSYSWSAPLGQFTTAASPDGSTSSALWAAPTKFGRVPVRVRVLDERGGTATAEAIIKIRLQAPLPQWLARFARTTADQAVSAIEARFATPHHAGFDGRIAGHQIGDASLDTARRDTPLDQIRDREPSELRGTVSALDVLRDTSLALTAESAEDSFVTVWARGAASNFDGHAGDTTLDGEVLSGMAGVDWTRGDWTAGLMVSRSQSEGGWHAPESKGDMKGTLTALYPYGRWQANQHISLWGIAGYGTGKFTVETAGGARIKTEMDLAMAAAGLRGVVLAQPETGGPEIAVKADALAARASARNALEEQGEVTRFRLQLEGVWHGIESANGQLTPSLMIGIRHDGGDAETGFGADVGAKVQWSDPKRGLAVDLGVRGLLTHADADFHEIGYSGSVILDPSRPQGRGPKFTLRHTAGVPATDGTDALLAPAGFTSGDNGAARQHVEARLSYGLPAFRGRATMTPEVGIGYSDTGRDYNLALKFTTTRQSAAGGGLAFGVGVSRRENTNSINFQLNFRW